MLQETSAAVSFGVVINFWLVSGLIRSKYGMFCKDFDSLVCLPGSFGNLTRRRQMFGKDPVNGSVSCRCKKTTWTCGVEGKTYALKFPHAFCIASLWLLIYEFSWDYFFLFFFKDKGESWRSLFNQPRWDFGLAFVFGYFAGTFRVWRYTEYCWIVVSMHFSDDSEDTSWDDFVVVWVSFIVPRNGTQILLGWVFWVFSVPED